MQDIASTVEASKHQAKVEHNQQLLERERRQRQRQLQRLQKQRRLQQQQRLQKEQQQLQKEQQQEELGERKPQKQPKPEKRLILRLAFCASEETAGLKGEGRGEEAPAGAPSWMYRRTHFYFSVVAFSVSLCVTGPASPPNYRHNCGTRGRSCFGASQHVGPPCKTYHDRLSFFCLYRGTAGRSLFVEVPGGPAIFFGGRGKSEVPGASRERSKLQVLFRACV